MSGYDHLNGYAKSGYKNGYAGLNGYSNSGYAQNGYANLSRNSYPTAQGQRGKDARNMEFGMGAGILGAMALSGSVTPLIGGTIAKAAATAGISSIAAVGAVPVAGALALGGLGMMIGGGVAAVTAPKLAKSAYNLTNKAVSGGVGLAGKGLGMALDGVYKGTKATLGAVGRGLSRSQNDNKNSNYEPKRDSKESEGGYKRAVKQSSKVDNYLNDAKSKFEKGENSQKDLQKISELKGLNRSQRKEISNQMSDNFLRNAAASSKDGKITNIAISKEVVKHSKEQGLNKKQTQKIQREAFARFDDQKNMQNITEKGHAMDGAFAAMPQAQKVAQTKAKSQKAAKTRAKNAALKNVEKHTEKSGNSVKAAANNPNFKPKPQKEQSQAKPQQAQKAQQQSAKSSKRSEKLQNDYFNESRGR